MVVDKTQYKRTLSESLAVLGWSDALSHLADLAREEGQREICGTLKILSDVLNDDLAAIDELLEDSYEQE